MKKFIICLALSTLVYTISPAIASEKIVFTPTKAPLKAQKSGEGWSVITDNNADASYQLESQKIPVTPGNVFEVHYDIDVSKGEIAIGLLNNSRNGWLELESILPKGKKGILSCIIPEGEKEATVVIRNYSLGKPGQSTFLVKNMEYTTAKQKKDVLAPLQLSSTKAPTKAQKSGKEWSVVTDNNANASYQLESQKIFSKPGSIVEIHYDIDVSKGKVAIGCLNNQRNGWLKPELSLQEGKNVGVYRCVIPEKEKDTIAVIRNDHLLTPGQSTFLVKNMEYKVTE